MADFQKSLVEPKGIFKLVICLAVCFSQIFVVFCGNTERSIYCRILNAVGLGGEDAVELFFTVTFWMVSNCRKINLSKIR